MMRFRATGTEEAFTALYEATRADMEVWVGRMARTQGSRRDPAELLQDTYVNIYRYAGSFRDGVGGGFRGWARTIAANVVRRSTQRTGAARALELPEGAGEPIDPRPGPLASCSDGEQQDELRRAWGLLLLHYAAAFQDLSPRDREALTLVEVEGKTYAEAGKLLRVGRSNMKMIMFRARKRIRAQVLAAMGTAAPGDVAPESLSRSLRAVG